MDQATKTRLRAEQLVGLTRLKRGLAPPGVRNQHTVQDTARDVQWKYLSHFSNSLTFLFPVFARHRPLTAKQLAALFEDLPLKTDSFENLDAMFDRLRANLGRSSRASAWHDLLLIERAIAKSRIAPRVSEAVNRLKQRLRTVRFGANRRVDRGGVSFMLLATDLITRFADPACDPRQAKPIGRKLRAAIYRRPSKTYPELMWLE